MNKNFIGLRNFQEFPETSSGHSISISFGGRNCIGLLFVNFIFCIFIGLRFRRTFFKFHHIAKPCSLSASLKAPTIITITEKLKSILTQQYVSEDGDEYKVELLPGLIGQEIKYPVLHRVLTLPGIVKKHSP